MSILRKIWGRTKTDFEDASTDQPKDKNYYHINFQNHENPKKSFSIGNDDQLNVYFTEKSGEKDNIFYGNSETECIMKKTQQKKYVEKREESSSELSFSEVPKNRRILSNPSVFTWQNKDAYIYKMESKHLDDDKRPDLEFVIYIPIDTAVKWLTSLDDKDKTQPSQTELNKGKAVLIKYGSEADEENTEYMLIADKSKSNSDSTDSSVEEDEDDTDDKTGAKPNKIKEKKVRGPKKVKKKARRIVTTYEEEEDEISLGRLRPREEKKDPLKIVEKKGILV